MKEFWKVNTSTHVVTRTYLNMSNIAYVEEFSKTETSQEQRILEAVRLSYPTLLSKKDSRLKLLKVHLTGGAVIHVLGALELFNG